MQGKAFLHLIVLCPLIVFLSGCQSVDSSAKPPLGTPEANAGPDLEAIEGGQVSLVGSGTDSNGSIASYLWEQSSGTEVVLSGSETATATFVAPDVNETLIFMLTVTDNDGNAWSDAVNVVIERLPNNPPEANAGSDQTVYVNSEITLRGSGSDTDGEVARFIWQQTAGVAVSLADNTSATTTFTTPNTPGRLTFMLTVVDDEGASTTDSVDINAGEVPKQAPDAEAGLPQNVLAGELVTLSGSATGGDGRVVSYQWQQTAGGVSGLGPTLAQQSQLLRAFLATCSIQRARSGGFWRIRKYLD